MNERPIPPAATRDANAVEMLRVWVAERGLHCSMKVGMYEENGPHPEDRAWGIILADAAKHLADALASLGIRDRETALQEIARSFASEVQNPTSESEGSFVD